MTKIRKTIDVPKKEFKKLQLLALQEDIPVKIFIENLIIDSLRDKQNFKLIPEKL